MQLALIPPVCVLGTTYRTRYQLALPHMLRSNEEYYLAYKFMCHWNHHVIMDNGVAEGEDKFTNKELIDLALEIRASEVVAPDVLGDSKATIERSIEFLNEFSWQRLGVSPERLSVEPLRVGIVAQGRTLAEAVNTVDTLLTKFPDLISTIFVPRLLIETTGNKFARLDLVRRLMISYNCTLPFHFLGASPLWISELKTVAETRLVRGMDTSAPYNYTLAEEYLHAPGKEVSRPDNYFETPLNQFRNAKHRKVDRKEMLGINLNTILEWASGVQI